MPGPHPLLELQRIDRAGDALRRERETLPERAALAEGQAALARLADAREAARERLVPLGREERRLESEVAALRAQAHEVETTLYGGSVRVVSELEGLQAKLVSLKERQAALEDEEMAQLEQQEALEQEIARLDEARAQVEADGRRQAESLAAAEARIDAQLDEVARERAAHVPSVPATLLATYERLRGAERLAGVVAAPLQGDACGACHTSLPITYVARVRAAAADEVVRCERCQRILVDAPAAP